MSNNIEDILDLGSFDKERKIPGTVVLEGHEFRYISCDSNDDIAVLFRKVIRKIDPPIPRNGGVINEGCRIILPTGETYFAISYKGDDIYAWRQQIEQGATALNLLVAKISKDKLLLRDGNEVLLSECEVQFD
jgi:hypothetical protein